MRQDTGTLPLIRWALLGSVLLLAACPDGASNTASLAEAGRYGPPTGRNPTPPPVAPLPPTPEGCPAIGDTLTGTAALFPELLVSEAVLERWQTYMVDLGPRYTGSDGLRRWHDFLAHQLAGAGLDVQREPVDIDWNFHKAWSLRLEADGEVIELPVASYFPYSGSTGPDGVTAPVEDVGQGLITDFSLADVDGKIAFFEVDMLPTTMGLFYANATYVHDPDMTLTPLTDYSKLSLSIITPQLSIIGPEQTTSLYNAREGGAVGAIISLEATARNAAGQYTPFHHHPGDAYGVPTLYVDRATGDRIKRILAESESVEATLELQVDEHRGALTDDIVATLPGQSDEVVIVNTHTDGTSASEENGSLAILAMARYFATLAPECRQRTLVFVLSPGHFHGGIGGDIGRFIKHHPEIMARAVASVTPEHLGQMEWLDDLQGGQGFHDTGLVEPAVIFGSPSPAVQLVIANAVIAEDLRRTLVSRPVGGVAIYFGLGSDLNSHGVPNAAFITGPEMLYSFAENQHLDKVDYARMHREIRTVTRIADAFDAADQALLCVGMPLTPEALGHGCFAELAAP